MTSLLVAQQQQHSRPVAAPGLRFDPDVPMAIQDESFSCSVYAADWCLRSLGVQSDDETLEAEMVARGVVTAQYGLMDARGYGLAAVLRDHLPPGTAVEVNESVTWDWLLEHAGFGPIALGGRAYVHWIAARQRAADQLLIANSAPGYKGVYQRLSRADFDRLGQFSAVMVPVS